MNTPLWNTLFYGTTEQVESVLNSRSLPVMQNKMNGKNKNTIETGSSIEHIYSNYLNKMPIDNSIYRMVERGEYILDEYLAPKYDEDGNEIDFGEEEDYIDMDDYDDFEERHVNYITEDEISSSDCDDDEWINV